MKERIPNEVIIKEAYYILDNNATVRQASKEFRRSKSSIHNDMKKQLPHIDKCLAKQVDVVLGINKKERTMRGGLSTKARWEAIKKH